MKKLIIIALLLTISACGGGDTYTTTTPPEPPPEPPPVALQRTIFIYDAAIPEIGTSDGVNYFTLAAEPATNARDGFISIGDILHGIDDTGTSIITQRLPIIPDKIAIQGSDIWCFEIIPADVAGPLGALWKPYTRIYLNNSEYGTWRDNQYEITDAIVTDSRDIVVLDTGGKYRNVYDQNMVVNYADHNGLLIHSIDINTRRVNIRDVTGDYRVAFNENYLLSSKPYIEADGVFYSWNGHSFANGVLTERATIMHEFTTLWYAERPVLVAVGSRIEHSEAVTYWIECNTGLMYRHTPSIDALEPVIRLWQGSGTRTDGLLARAEVKPVMTDDNLFYTWQGTVSKYGFASGVVGSFAAGVEIWRM